MQTEQQQTEQPPEAKQSPEARARSLFALVERMRALLTVVDDAEGELTPELAAQLDGVAESISLKAEVYKAVCGSLEAEADACDAMAAPYLARAKAKRSRVAQLKARLRDALELAGLDRAVGPTGGAALQAGQARVELIVSEDDVPDVYCEHERKVSRKTLAAALKANDPRALECAKLVRGKAIHWK